MSTCRRAAIAFATALALLAGAVAVHAHAPSSAAEIEPVAEAEATGGACWLCRSSVKQGGPRAEARAGLALARATEPAAPVLRCASRHHEPAAARAPPSIDL